MSWALRFKCSSICSAIILCTAKTSPVLGLLGNIMMIMELAVVVSLANVDCLLQLGLRASTMSQKTGLKNWCFLDALITPGVDGLPLRHAELM